MNDALQNILLVIITWGLSRSWQKKLRPYKDKKVNMTAKDFAERLCQFYGFSQVNVQVAEKKRLTYYHCGTKTLFLSEEIAADNSLYATMIVLREFVFIYNEFRSGLSRKFRSRVVRLLALYIPYAGLVYVVLFLLAYLLKIEIATAFLIPLYLLPTLLALLVKTGNKQEKTVFKQLLEEQKILDIRKQADDKLVNNMLWFYPLAMFFSMGKVGDYFLWLFKKD